jgi:hypothetical protein
MHSILTFMPVFIHLFEQDMAESVAGGKYSGHGCGLVSEFHSRNWVQVIRYFRYG